MTARGHDPSVTLRQIQQAAIRSQTICDGRTLESLSGDWQARAALERFLEILGEAVKRLRARIREQNPQIPWNEIAGTRDRLIHGYDDVDYRILWDAVQTDIPPLLATVERILGEGQDL